MSIRLAGEHLPRWSTHRLVITVRLRWSTKAGVIGAIAARGAAMIAVATIMTKAGADTESGSLGRQRAVVHGYEGVS